MSSKKLDAAIDALVGVLAELPEHELEGWQRGNRPGLRTAGPLGCPLAASSSVLRRQHSGRRSYHPDRPATILSRHRDAMGAGASH
jgi:hypothetical protein